MRALASTQEKKLRVPLEEGVSNVGEAQGSCEAGQEERMVKSLKSSWNLIWLLS